MDANNLAIIQFLPQYDIDYIKCTYARRAAALTMKKNSSIAERKPITLASERTAKHERERESERLSANKKKISRAE